MKAVVVAVAVTAVVVVVTVVAATVVVAVAVTVVAAVAVASVVTAATDTESDGLICCSKSVGIRKRVQIRAFRGPDFFVSGLIAVWRGAGVSAAGLQHRRQGRRLVPPQQQPTVPAVHLCVRSAFHCTVA